IATISERHSLSEKTVRSTLSLALLAPDIMDAAIEGRLPRSLTTTQMLNLPADWQEQSKVLGLI
ncbi:MAG: recombinase family protein, partial [Aestuariivirga sp.]